MENTSDSFMPRPLLFCLKSGRSVCYSVPDNIQGLLSNATNNINQIAKRVNSTGVIYKEDIGDIKKEIEHFSKELWQIHSLLLNRTSGGD